MKLVGYEHGGDRNSKSLGDTLKQCLGDTVSKSWDEIAKENKSHGETNKIKGEVKK